MTFSIFRENLTAIMKTWWGATLLTIVMGTGTTGALSAEVDHYTYYFKPLPNMLPRLNHVTGSWVFRALERVNKAGEKEGGQGCREDDFYKVFSRYFSSLTKSFYVRELIYDRIIEGVLTDREDSVYRDFSFTNHFFDLMGAIFHYPVLSEVIRLGDIKLGTDKLEHMWANGYDYFQIFYREKQSIGKALKKGWESENGWLGKKVSGVISYGDLAANFNGMRFWNHLLQKNEDILGENLGPYIQCENNRWVQVKKIDWSVYMDKAIDESVNCSVFKTGHHVRLLERELGELSSQQAIEVEFGCPMIEPHEKNFLEDKYGVFAKHLLNFYGHMSVSQAESLSDDFYYNPEHFEL